MFWMEVDVKRRRGAPWAAPVPEEIAERVRHLRRFSDDTCWYCERPMVSIRVVVIARSEATKQSIFLFAHDGLLAGACHRRVFARPGGSQ